MYRHGICIANTNVFIANTNVLVACVFFPLVMIGSRRFELLSCFVYTMRLVIYESCVSFLCFDPSSVVVVVVVVVCLVG
jgi:hypothetical protein